MMENGVLPEVVFTLLQQREKALHLGRWAEKFYAEGERVLLRVLNQKQAQALDRYLWTWSKDSFLPHGLMLNERDQILDPIAISTADHNPNDATVLIMAHPCSIPFMKAFRLVIDFAEVYDPVLAQQSRDRFRAYRDHGFSPRMSSC